MALKSEQLGLRSWIFWNFLFSMRLSNGEYFKDFKIFDLTWIWWICLEWPLTKMLLKELFIWAFWRPKCGSRLCQKWQKMLLSYQLKIFDKTIRGYNSILLHFCKFWQHVFLDVFLYLFLKEKLSSFLIGSHVIRVIKA